MPKRQCSNVRQVVHPSSYFRVSLDKRHIILSHLIFALCLPEETMFDVYRETNVQYTSVVCFYQFCFELGELIQTHMKRYRKHSIMNPQAKLKLMSGAKG